MDKAYIAQARKRLQQERSLHGEKFGNHPGHKTCLERFDIALAKLQRELEPHAVVKNAEEQPSLSVLPDGLANQSTAMVAKQLNQLDGFDR